MCRMIIGIGDVDKKALLNAAVDMSLCKTDDHGAGLGPHVDGWGATWQDKKNLSESYHSVEPIADSYERIPLDERELAMLAIHTREATLDSQKGMQYAHPVSIDSRPDYSLMHNGYLPSVHELLPQAFSGFDSKDLLQYLIHDVDTLDEHILINKLQAIRPESEWGAANCFLFHGDHVYVVNWTLDSVIKRKFFQLYYVLRDDMLCIASEIQPSLAASEQWQALPDCSVTKLTITSEKPMMFNPVVALERSAA